MKRYQWVAVSVCFVLAVTLWFLVTLNKQTYSTSFSLPLKLTNFPRDLQLLSEFPKEIDISATGPGIKLFYQEFTPIRDTVRIDFSIFRDKGYFVSKRNLSFITAALKKGLSAISASPDTISLAYAVKSNKKVAVKLDVEFDLPSSFRVQREEMEFTDTVLIVGPLDSLKHVTECKTVHFKLPSSTDPQVIVIPLDSMGPMQMIPNSIVLQYTPRPYTEKVIKLPVKSTGVPIGMQVRYDPDSVEVKLLMPLSKFETVGEGQISAEVDFQTISSRSKLVLAKIMHVPKDVEIVSFNPRTVRYTIIARE